MASFAPKTSGQNHERFVPDDSLNIPSILPDDGDREPVEITAFQKMLSATTGSLLTGILGMSWSLEFPEVV